MDTESFNLHETIAAVGQAMQAVICHMLFDFALYGLLIVAILVIVGYCFVKQEHPYGISMLKVAKRIAIFCLIVAAPGAIYLLLNHHLPQAGVFSFNFIGLICFWTWISVHLVAEDINTSMIKAGKNKVSD